MHNQHMVLSLNLRCQQHWNSHTPLLRPLFGQQIDVLLLAVGPQGVESACRLSYPEKCFHAAAPCPWVCRCSTPSAIGCAQRSPIHVNASTTCVCDPGASENCARPGGAHENPELPSRSHDLEYSFTVRGTGGGDGDAATDAHADGDASEDASDGHNQDAGDADAAANKR